MKRALFILVGVVIVAVLASRGLLGDRVDTEINNTARELNLKVPQVDGPTRWDHVTPTHHGLTYEYTIMGSTGNNLTQQQKAHIESTARATLKSKPELHEMLDAGVALRFVFRNDGGATLVDFTVLPSDIR